MINHNSGIYSGNSINASFSEGSRKSSWNFGGLTGAISKSYQAYPGKTGEEKLLHFSMNFGSMLGLGAAGGIVGEKLSKLPSVKFFGGAKFAFAEQLSKVKLTGLTSIAGQLSSTIASGVAKVGIGVSAAKESALAKRAVSMINTTDEKLRTTTLGKVTLTAIKILVAPVKIALAAGNVIKEGAYHATSRVATFVWTDLPTACADTGDVLLNSSWTELAGRSFCAVKRHQKVTPGRH